jgi:hypothetical protein
MRRLLFPKRSHKYAYVPDDVLRYRFPETHCRRACSNGSGIANPRLVTRFLDS